LFVEEYVFNDSAKRVVFPEGMEPTNSEIARINQAVITRGIGLGVIFVHIFTESDIESNCLVKTDLSFFWYHASFFSISSVSCIS
jgi:hypothetical protein